MWKKFKKSAIVIAYIFALTIFLLMLSPVQTIICKRELAKIYPDVELQKCKVGFQTLNLSRLTLKDNLTTVRLENAKIKWSLINFICLNKLCIKDAEVSGLSISVNEKSSESMPKVKQQKNLKHKRLSPNEFFTKYGVIVRQFLVEHKKIHMPLSATIDKLAITGHCQIQDNLVGDFSAQASNICQFMQGNLSFELKAIDKNLNNVELAGTSTIKQNGRSEIEGMAISGQYKYSDKNTNNEQQIIFNSNFDFNTSEQTTLHANIFNNTNNCEILYVDCKYIDKTKILSVISKIDINQNNFLYPTSIASSQSLSVESVLSSEYNFNESTGILNCNAVVNMNKEYAQKYLYDIDSNLTFILKNNISFDNQSINVHDLIATLTSVSKSCDITMSLPQALSFHKKYLGDLHMLSGNATGILIDIKNVDVKLFKTFFAENLITGTLKGKYNIKYIKNALIIENLSDAHTELNNLSVQIGEQNALKIKQMLCDLQVAVNETLTVNISNLSANDNDNRNITQGDIEFNKNDKQTKFKLYCVSDLPCMLAQNIFSVTNIPYLGLLSTKFDMTTTGNNIDCKLDTKINGLLFDKQISSIDASCFSEFNNNNNNIQIHCPIIIDSIDTSDIILDITSTKSEKHNINISVEGSTVYPKDIYSILSLCKINQSALARKHNNVETQSIKPINADNKSAWSNFNINLNAQIDKIAITKDYTFSKFLMTSNVNEEQIVIDNISMNMAEAPLKAKAKMMFDAKSEKLYTLDGSCSLKTFDLGRFYRAIKETRSPAISGKISMLGTMRSNSANFLDTITDACWTLKLEGYNGSLRLIESVDNKTKGAIMLTNIASMIINRNNPSENVTSNLIQSVQEIYYDSLSCEIVRNETKDIDLKFLTIRGPEILLLSNGKIISNKQSNFAKQSLQLSSQLNVKGKLAQSFQNLGLIYGEMPNSDYFVGPQFTIHGTVTQPDCSELKTIIQEAGIRLITNKKL